MEFEIFTICDHVEDYGGKLVISGTFDTIYSNKFPAVQPNMAIAGRLRLTGPVKQHSFLIKIVDKKGKDVNPSIEGTINVDKEGIGGYSSVNLAFNLSNVTFENAGTYYVILHIDNKKVRSLSFNLTNLTEKR